MYMDYADDDEEEVKGQGRSSLMDRLQSAMEKVGLYQFATQNKKIIMFLTLLFY
jgi:hypothetical protein